MDGVLASAVAIGSLIPIIRLSKDISTLETTLREMKGIPIVSPEKLLYHLKSGSDAIRNHFKSKGKTASGDDLIAGKVFVQGVIDAKYPVKSLLEEKRLLVYRDFYVENIFSNERAGSSNSLHSTKRKFFDFSNK
jgi:predicted xylose isomerase-like sugar epimerase